MDPWVAFGIGVALGLLVGIFASGLGKGDKSDDQEFNQKGEYRCNYTSEEIYKPETKNPSMVESISLVNLERPDTSIYLMPNDGVDYLNRQNLTDGNAKKFGVIRCVGDPQKPKDQ